MILAAWASKQATSYSINFNLINNNIEDWFGLVSRLTIKELRSYPGCENYSDEYAERVIESLFQLSILGVNAFNTQTEQSIFVVEK